MPTYEYVCTECGRKSEVRATLAEKQKGLDMVCAACGGRRMTRVFGGFAVGRSSGSGASACPPDAGPGCCRGR